MTIIEKLKLQRQRLTNAIRYCESAVDRAEIEARIKEIDDELSIREDQLGKDIAEVLKESTDIDPKINEIVNKRFVDLLNTTVRAEAQVVSECRLKSCTWTEEEDGNWKTQCDNIYVIIEGTPTENKMNFCCYCGGTIKEVRYPIKESDNG